MADKDEGVSSGLAYSVLEEVTEAPQPSYRPSAFINSGPAANRITTKGYLRACVPHLVIATIYLVYIFVGGGVFLAIQRADQAPKRNEILLDVSKFEGLERLLDNATSGRGDNVMKYWKEYERLAEGGFLEDAYSLGGPDLTYMRSVMYCLATIATIGTDEYLVLIMKGRAFIAVYALVGIPLTLIFLVDIGNLLARLVDALYSRCCCRRGHSSRPSGIYRGTSEPVTSGNQPDLVDGEPRGRSWQETEWGRRDVPALLVLAIWLVYFLLAGFFIAVTEQSSYGRGLFFTFVTMTTTSLGELVKFNHTTTHSSLACLVQILANLCVMSMCLILLLPKIVRVVSKVSSKFNL